MNAYESTGKTVEEAISEGLSKLGLSIGEVQVEILEEGSKGLFGLFGSRMAKVRLTVKEDLVSPVEDSIFADSLDSYDAKGRIARREAQKTEQAERAERAEERPAPAPRQREQKVEDRPAAEKKAEPRPPRKQRAPKAEEAQSTERPEEEEAAEPARKKPSRRRKGRASREPRPIVPAEQLDPSTKAGKVQTFLQELTKLMGVTVSVHVHTDEEGNIRAAMDGDVLGILIGRRGETLDALQYLTSLHLNRGQEGYTRVTLDSEGYRARREDALVRLANRMANRATKTGRRVSMEPMNPYERRILHSALQNHPGITTHSEGEEPNRHVVITVNKDGESAPKEDEQD